jgi:hypothetical protein
MFKVTSAALEVLDRAIRQERNTEDEKLFIRLTMGVG